MYILVSYPTQFCHSYIWEPIADYNYNYTACMIVRLRKPEVSVIAKASAIISLNTQDTVQIGNLKFQFCSRIGVICTRAQVKDFIIQRGQYPVLKFHNTLFIYCQQCEFR